MGGGCLGLLNFQNYVFLAIKTTFPARKKNSRLGKLNIGGSILETVKAFEISIYILSPKFKMTSPL